MGLPNITQEINTIKSTYLPKSGGTLTGRLDFSQSGGGGYIYPSGNTFYVGGRGQDGRDTSFIRFYGLDSESPGSFVIHTRNNDGGWGCGLFGNNEGGLWWNNSKVITSNGGEITGKLYTYNGQGYELRHQTASIGDTTRPSDSWQMLCQGLDKDEKRSGGVEISYGVDGSRGMYFTLRNRYDNAYLWAGLREHSNGYCDFHVNGNPVVTLISQWKSGTNWYRKYSDGWIEQGGYVYCGSWGTWLTYHLPFSDTGYYLNANAGEGTDGVRFVSFYARNTTGAGMYTGDDSSFNSANLYWYACGY